jgi:hypothetical protein
MTTWESLLAPELPSPPAWRLAWALVGLPDPVPVASYRAVLEAFEERFGVAEVVRGLRFAGQQPVMSGWTPAQQAHVRTLAARYEAVVGGQA